MTTNLNGRGPARKARSRTGAKSRQAARSPELSVLIDEDRQPLDAARLADTVAFDDLVGRCRQAGRLELTLDGLLEAATDHRWGVLDFANILPGVHLRVGGKTYEGLLEAVLSFKPGGAVESVGRWKAAVLEVAVLAHGNVLGVACAKLRDRMKELKLTATPVRALVKEAEVIRRRLHAGPGGLSAPVKVRAVLQDAPVAPDAVLPAGWALSDGGIARTSGDAQPLIAGPVLLKERGLDVQRQTETLTLVHHRDGCWKVLAVDRLRIADHRQVVQLAAHGLPVTSLNARDLVEFLAAFEAANLPHLPVVRYTSKMGWLPGQEAFLVGRQLVTAQGVDADGTDGASVRFRGAGEGDDQLADGYRVAGTLEGWVRAAALTRPYPRALLGLYASFVPPLLRPLDTPSFLFDCSGQTSGGKTTALQMFASAYGNPDGASAGSVLHTWNSSATWRERALAVLDGVPLVLDDTKNVRFANEVAQVIYMVVQGRGRGRGTVTGIAHQGSWSTVLFSSGEQALTSFTNADDGVRARVLQICGSPFGTHSPEAGSVVKEIARLVRANYGHAGPLFVRHLLQQRDQWPAWRQWFQEVVRYYEAKAGGDAVAGRMAEHFAVIVVASRIAHEALPLPWEWADPVGPLWPELTREAAAADRPTLALRRAHDWAVAHRSAFAGPRGLCDSELSSNDGDPPPGGWAGRWDLRGGRVGSGRRGTEEGYVGFLRGKLDEVLRGGGFEPGSVVRAWKERGWLIVNHEAGGRERNTLKVRVGDQWVPVIAISLEVIRRVGVDAAD